MTPTEKLQRIRARCVERRDFLLSIDRSLNERLLLASLMSTIAAIDRLSFDVTGNAAVIDIILTAWPDELL